MNNQKTIFFPPNKSNCILVGNYIHLSRVSKPSLSLFFMTQQGECFCLLCLLTIPSPIGFTPCLITNHWGPSISYHSLFEKFQASYHLIHTNIHFGNKISNRGDKARTQEINHSTNIVAYLGDDTQQSQRKLGCI